MKRKSKLFLYLNHIKPEHIIKRITDDDLDDETMSLPSFWITIVMVELVISVITKTLKEPNVNTVRLMALHFTEYLHQALLFLNDEDLNKISKNQFKAGFKKTREEFHTPDGCFE